MAVKINKTIKGKGKNDTLVNKNTSGYNLMQGGAGNDTYIINTISKTFTDINDTKGTDNVQIKGANGNDLLFFFDVVVDESYGNVGDELFVIDKKNMNTALKQMQKFLANPNDSKNIPQSGAVCIDYYFGNTNNIQENGKLGTNYGNNYIEKIYAVNSTGAKYLYDLKPYFKTARERILTFLQNNGYNAASDVLLSNNETHKEALINIYKNTPINYTVTGSAKNDKLTGGSGNDLIKGNNGNDNINGANGNDKLYGGAGNDNINGSNGNDKLYGEAGNDVLNGGAGNDQLTGGKGKDKLYTGAGNDIVYFNSGDGADTLYKGSGADTLRFNNFANISKLKSGLKMSKSGNNLVIKYTSKDSVTLYNYFKSGVGTSVATLMAKDGKTINFADFYGSYIFKAYTGTKNKTNKITGSALNDLIKGNNKNDTLNGGSGNDKIYGYAGNDSIHGNAGNDYIDGGDGNDKLYGDAGNDTIKGGKGKDQIWGGAGNDVIYGNYDTNTLKGEAGNDKIYGGTGVDKIYAGAGNDYVDGGAGNDVIYGESGTNTLIGNKGNDKLYSGTGDDTFKFASGDGADTFYNATSLDKIEFTGTVDGIYYGFDVTGKDLEIYRKTGDQTDKVTISDYVNSEDKIDKIVYNGVEKSIKDDAVIETTVSGEYYGTILNDKITTSPDTDENINAGLGNNTIIITGGNDTINAGGGNDTLVFEGLTDINQLSGEYQDNDLVLTYTGGSVTLKDYLDGNHSVTNIQINNTPMTVVDYMNTQEAKKVVGTTSNDSVTATDKTEEITAGKGDDTIDLTNSKGVTVHIKTGDGIDTIKNLKPNDILSFEDSSSSSVVPNYNPETKNLELSYGEDKIIIENYPNTSKDGKIKFNSGSEQTISAFLESKNIVIGSDNGATISDKSYVTLYAGSGNDIITNVTGTIYAGAGADSITAGDNGSSTIYGGEGEDTITAGNKIAHIIGGSGDDTLKRGTSSKSVTYNFASSGDGNDTIIDDLNDTKNSYLVFTGLEGLEESEESAFYDSFTYEQKGDDLIIHYAGDNSIKIEDFMTKEYSLRNKLILNNTSIDVKLKSGVNLYGTGNDDTNLKGSDTYKSTVNGYEGNDTITAGTQETILVGGSGNDTLQRGSSTDKVTYEFASSGDGNDTIIDNLDSFSYIKFTGLNESTEEDFYNNIEYIQEDNDLVIHYADDNRITFKDYMTKSYKSNLYYKKLNGNSSINSILSSNGVKVIGTNNNDNDLKGSDAYNSTVNGYAGNDTITAGAKDATINGGAGSDIITGGTGSSSTYILNGEYGDDTITANYGNTTINGGSGNDTLKRGVSTNNVTYEFASSGDGNDTIIDNLDSYSSIKFTGLTEETEQDFYDAITYEQRGDDLVIRYAENSSITVKDYVISDKKTNLSIKQLKNNLSLYIDSEIRSKGISIYGTENGDNLEVSHSYNAVINGNGGNDTITAGEGWTTINGGAGADVITGGSGKNVLNGDADNDRITAGTGATTIVGGAGNDTLERTAASNNYIYYQFDVNGDGNDTIVDGLTGSSSSYIQFTGINDATEYSNFINSLKYSEDGDDVIIRYGTNYSSTITIKDFSTNDHNTSMYLYQAGGNPRLLDELNDKAFEFYGTSGDDSLSAQHNYKTVIYGYGGNDTIIGSRKPTTIYGGQGDDLIKCAEPITVDGFTYSPENGQEFNGEEGNDTIIAHNGKTTINGGIGDDVIFGGDSNVNILNGDEGNDSITAGTGSATISGGDGNDTIIGGSEGNILKGDAGDDSITAGTSLATIIGGAGNDTIDVTSASHSTLKFNINGDGNDIIYHEEQSSDNTSVIEFENDESSIQDKDWWDENVISTINGNDLILTYGNNSSITVKNYASYGRYWQAEIGTSNAVSLANILTNIKTGTVNADNITVGNEDTYTYLAAGLGDDTLTTNADKSIIVSAGAGSNTINSYGNDTICVDKEATDTINLYTANSTKSVVVENGSKATINGTMDLTPQNESTNPLVINFADQDFTIGDVMVYHNYNDIDDGLHFVTRHNGLDVEVTGIYDVDYDEEVSTNYLIDTDGTLPFAKFAITDKNGKDANIKELTNYWNMANHSSNVFYSEYSAIVDAQGGSQNWLIDGTDDADNYTIDLPSDIGTKIDIYDLGGETDVLCFENDSFYQDIQGGQHGYSTFFDVNITRNSDNTLSSTFGNDLYFSGNMVSLFDTDPTNDTYACIHNYFDGNIKGAGCIESITDESSNNTIDFDKLTALKGEVASWIATNTDDCYSVSDVIAKGNSELTNQLMAVFTNHQTF